MRNIMLLIGALFVGLAVHAADKKTTQLDVSGELTWTGFGVGKKHVGTLQLKSGNILMSGEQITGGEFIIDMTSLDTKDSEKLKGHLRSADFFDVEKNPEATFKITKVVALTAGGSTHQFTGDLTIKGKTAPLTLNATVKKEAKKWSASADAEIVDRTVYDIRYNSKQFAALAKLGDKLIEDNIKIQLNVTTK